MQILVETTSTSDTDAVFALIRLDDLSLAAITDARTTLDKFFLAHGGYGSLIIRGITDVLVLNELPEKLEEFVNHDGETAVVLPDDKDRFKGIKDDLTVPTECAGLQVWASSVRLCTYLRHTTITIDSPDISELLLKQV